MTARRFRRCSSVRSTATRLVQVDRLDPEGPLHPDSESSHWPIHDPFDAIDAIDLSQPADFRAGVLVLFTNDEREVLAALAVRNAPADDLQPILAAIIEVTRPAPGGWTVPVRGVVLGIIREPLAEMLPFTHAVTAPVSTSPTQAEEQHWRLTACELAEHGIDLIDVLSINAQGWSSIALTSGELRYPDDSDCRLRWYELD